MDYLAAEKNFIFVHALHDKVGDQYLIWITQVFSGCNLLVLISDEKYEPVVMMLDQQYTYGCEFYGAQPIVGLTPITDKCYLSMSQALQANKGAMLTGGTGSGKTETVKVNQTL